MKIFIIAVTWFGIVLSSVASAADFEKELSKAMINMPAGADVAGMGNAWVATPYFSSNNAALTAIGEYELGGASLSYGLVDFEKGPDVQFWSSSAAIKLPVGVFQLSYTAGGSDRKTFYWEVSEDGNYSENAKFDSLKVIDLQYGLLVRESIFFSEDKIYLGIGYNYSEGNIKFGQRFSADDFSLSGVLVSKSKSHSWSAGAVYQPNPKISLGVFYARSWDKGKDRMYLDEELIETDSYKEQSNQYRFGIGLQLTPSTFIAADYQHLDLPSGNSDQFFVGVEQAIVGDWIYLYGGWAGDGPTTGIGIYFENGGLNLAYMHDTNDGLEETLGKTRIFMAGAYINF